MSRNYELDALKSREQEVFSRKQAAFERYAEARDSCSEAHDMMESAWEIRCSAREEMNREYEEMQRSSEHYREVWDEYGMIRDRNNYEIERLRAEADSEHQEMIDCFNRASDCYEYGDKSEAPYWSQQGHEHKERRDSLNEEVKRLCEEVKSAKQDAKWRAPKTDPSAFHSAKEIFERAKSCHEAFQAEFKRLKKERDAAKAEFDSLQAEHVRLKEEFQSKLEEVKASKVATKQQAIDKVNMALVKSNAHYLGTIFGHDAKIVPKRDNSGKIDVYFGGLNAAGDGPGHGHAIIDRNGNVTYLRDAWVANTKTDYLINENADKFGGETHKI